VAGVEAIRKGTAEPIGSLTQMGTIRLGKRTDNRCPKIKDFVPLADLDDIVFGAWDIFPDSAYEAALHAGVLEKSQVEDLREQLESLKPMQAVFSQNYVKRLNGDERQGTGKNKMELAEQLIEDIARFKEEKGCDRWSSSGRLRPKFFSNNRRRSSNFRSV
jgi:myo-inositol-1-phosphate synthase